MPKIDQHLIAVVLKHRLTQWPDFKFSAKICFVERAEMIFIATVRVRLVYVCWSCVLLPPLTLIDFPAPLFKSHLPRLSLPDQSITMVSQPISHWLHLPALILGVKIQISNRFCDGVLLITKTDTQLGRRKEQLILTPKIIQFGFSLIYHFRK